MRLATDLGRRLDIPSRTYYSHEPGPSLVNLSATFRSEELNSMICGGHGGSLNPYLLQLFLFAGGNNHSGSVMHERRCHHRTETGACKELSIGRGVLRSGEGSAESPPPVMTATLPLTSTFHVRMMVTSIAYICQRRKTRICTIVTHKVWRYRDSCCFLCL